ncbi:MAG: transglycosylase domain-containing protein [Treponema sp.]|jgi:penicillin-binding protein 1C|nr:transglycosylase domain-containing protein [Treponema sp.]
MKKIVRIAVIALVCLLVLHAVLRFTPYPELAGYRNRSYGFAALDRKGRTLRVFPSAGGIKREWLPVDEIPAGVLRVFIRAEDARFYLHPGVDPAAVIASCLRNLRAGRVVSGASTITMQLARLLKPRGHGLRGKMLEALDALRLEARLSKKQILELWINGIPFGGNIEGLPAASRARFGRTANGLDDARAVLLAVIPRRPGLYDPARSESAAVNAAMALARRCRLNLDEAALMEIAAEAAPGKLADEKAPFYAPHFTDRIENRGRYPAHTTLDLDLQLYAENRLASELALLENNRVSNGAVLAVDNSSGEVLVYIGSASWFDDDKSGKIDGVRVRNQSGSCLKPFLYALALEKGFAPNDILPDIPTVFGGGEAYSPGNFNRRFNGPVRFRIALGSSLNIPAVYLLEKLGVRNFEDWLADLGFDSIAASKGSVASFGCVASSGDYGLGLALGNAEVSLEELTRAFAVFPRGGRALELKFTAIPQGNAGGQQEESRRIMPPYSAWLITDILSDQASRFTGFGTAPTFSTEFPSIFKTGTANQFQHIWALGATPRYTVGVWMGNFSGETVIGRTGSSIPARIAADLLRALEGGQTPGGKSFPPVPDSVREIRICSLSGMAAGPFCAGSAAEWLSGESKDAGGLCSWHRQPGAAPTYPPEYQAWLAERFRRGSPDLQSGSSRIRLPVSGSVFYFNPSLPPDTQAIRIETAGFNADALVYANDVLQGSLNSAGVFHLTMRRGRQRIAVEDGSSIGAVEIEVK